MDPWMIGLGVTVISTLIGVIYTSGQRRDDKQDVRAGKNEEDATDLKDMVGKLTERVVKTETIVEIHDKELGKLRDMRHEILKDVSHTLAGWYAEIMDYLRKKLG